MPRLIRMTALVKYLNSRHGDVWGNVQSSESKCVKSINYPAIFESKINGFIQNIEKIAPFVAHICNLEFGLLQHRTNTCLQRKNSQQTRLYKKMDFIYFSS